MSEVAHEEWRPVLGFEGTYSVSSLGRVRSEPRTVVLTPRRSQRLNGRVLTPCNHSGGYLIVAISVNGRPKTKLIHKLVLEAFVGPRPAGNEARHLNGIPSDNRAANLAWGTAFENADDRERHGRQVRGSAVGNSKLTDAAVKAIRADKRAQAKVAADFGVTQTMVSRIKLGKAWGWLA